jgi:hypothetical protein
LTQKITGASINYYREGGTILQSGNGYIQFNVTKINSSIWYATSPSSASTFYPLNIGSQIKIIPNTSTTYTIISPNVRIFGIGDQFWELTVSNATVTVINQSGTQDVVSLNSGTKVLITHAWITGYKDFKSTLGLTTTSTPGNYYTELVMNNYTSYTSSQNFIQVLNKTVSNTIVINNIQPTGAGLFLLQYDVKTSGNSTYFVGNGTYSVI